MIAILPLLDKEKNRFFNLIPIEILKRDFTGQANQVLRMTNFG